MEKIKAIMVKTGKLSIFEKDTYDKYVSLIDTDDATPIVELAFDNKKQFNRYVFIFEQLKALTIVEKEVISAALQIYYHLFVSSSSQEE